MSHKTQIKLIRFPYKNFEVGEIVDLGEEKNKSMVALQRAVWYDEGEIKKHKSESNNHLKEVVKLVISEENITGKDNHNDRVLENNIRKEVSKKKSGNNFWDNLK